MELAVGDGTGMIKIMKKNVGGGAGHGTLFFIYFVLFIFFKFIYLFIKT
jgi:hypothetical protein